MRKIKRIENYLGRDFRKNFSSSYNLTSKMEGRRMWMLELEEKIDLLMEYLDIEVVEVKAHKRVQKKRKKKNG